MKTTLINKSNTQKIEIYQTDNLVLIFRYKNIKSTNNNYIDKLKTNFNGENILSLSDDAKSIIITKFSNNEFAHNYSKVFIANMIKDGYLKAMDDSNYNTLIFLKSLSELYPDFFEDLYIGENVEKNS